MTSREPVDIFLFLLLIFTVLLVLFLLWMFVCETYAFFKSFRKGPITLTPVIPFPQDNLQVFKGTDKLKNVVPDAKIQVYNGKTKFRLALPPDNNMVMVGVNKFMASTFKLLPDEYQLVNSRNNQLIYTLKPKISVPENARTISIKMNGFEHGERCHDFEPIGGAAPGSHYTYQMYGDSRIQVTRYVVDGKSDVAGFCIYIEHLRLSKLEYRWTLLNQMAQFAKTSTMPETSRPVGTDENSQLTESRGTQTNQPKIEVIPEENTKLMSQDSEENHQNWTIKYCSKLRREVMSSMDSGEVVVHREWIHGNKRMRIEKCEECTKEGLEKEEQPPTYSSIFVV